MKLSPAVFDSSKVQLEFGKIEWAPFQGGSQRGRGVVTIHLVTDWTEGGHDAAFDLSHRFYKALDGLSGESFNGRRCWRRTRTTTTRRYLGVSTAMPCATCCDRAHELQ